MNNIIEDLIHIGFTKNEAKTYLTLTELGETQTGKLCDKVGIPDSHIYKILNSLIKKGVISYKLKNNIKIYQSTPPEALNTLYLQKQEELEQQRKNIQNTIQELKKAPQQKETESDYKYFQGIPGIKALWYEINTTLKTLNKQKEVKLYSGRKGTYEKLLGFNQEFHKERMKQNILYKAIFPKEETKEAEKREKQLAQIKFSNITTDIQWAIIGDIFTMQNSTGKTPYGFLIKDEHFAKTFEAVFDKLWNNTKE